MQSQSIDSVDSYLIAINIAVLASFFFVFQSRLTNSLVKWSLLISFVLFITSLLLLIWHKFRYPKRLKILDSLREKTLNKFSGRIASFVDEMVVPFFRLQAKDDTLKRLELAKNKKEYDQILASITEEVEDLKSGKAKARKPSEDKVTRFIIESFVEHMASETKDDYDKAFKSPLEESHAKIKYYTDRVAIKFRRHIFASASVFIVFSVLIQILNQ